MKEPFTIKATITSEIKDDEIHIREQIDALTGKWMLSIIKTKDEEVQRRLVQMGWTPPAETAALKARVERAEAEREEMRKSCFFYMKITEKTEEYLDRIIKASDSDEASGGEMWYAEVVSVAIESVKTAIAAKESK